MSTKHVCVYRSMRYPEIKDEVVRLLYLDGLDVHADAKNFRQILQWTPFQLARHLDEIGELNNAHGLKKPLWESLLPEANGLRERRPSRIRSSLLSNPRRRQPAESDRYF